VPHSGSKRELRPTIEIVMINPISLTAFGFRHCFGCATFKKSNAFQTEGFR